MYIGVKYCGVVVKCKGDDCVSGVVVNIWEGDEFVVIVGYNFVVFGGDCDGIGM